MTVRPIRGVFLFVVLLVAGLGRVGASQVRPINLEEMSRSAERIFSGRCTAIETTLDPDLGLDVTVATFEVERTARGAHTRTLTIRFLGGEVPGLPRFREGEEVVLFLYGESSRGLTSPVGFGQGKFTVHRDKTGRPFVANEIGNRNLFHGLTDRANRRIARWERPRASRLISPQDLLDMVSAIDGDGSP